MSLRSLPEKISSFLIQCSGRMYCDTCIQERLGLKWRQQVQLVTATLAVTDGYRREFNCCSVCHMDRQVIVATRDQPDAPMTANVLFPASTPHIQSSEVGGRETS